jgi:hypothetical protein
MPKYNAIRYSCYIINEVKESYSKSGCQNNVVVICSEGIKELPPKDVKTNYDVLLRVNAGANSPPLRRAGLSEEDIEKIWLTG